VAEGGFRQRSLGVSLARYEYEYGVGGYLMEWVAPVLVLEGGLYEK
jgi:hypothetical protein